MRRYVELIVIGHRIKRARKTLSPPALDACSEIIGLLLSAPRAKVFPV